jgi:Carboxypeptidase regulatory-like domain
MRLPFSAPFGVRSNTLVNAIRASLTFALAILLMAPCARAQYRASIQGVVTDPTGAVIPGATLTLTNNATNEKKQTTSNDAGIYNFNALPPDTFTLVAEKDGFQKKVLDHLQLIPEQANAVDVQLTVGGAATSVTINAEAAPSMDRETADQQISINPEQIQHFPEFERDPTQLIQLAPGALSDGAQQGGGGGFASPGTQSGASHGGGGNLGASSSIFATENGASANANGGQFENNGYTVDGISTASAVWGGSTVITPSEDSIGNIKIITNDYDAENGRFDGALTEITTKSGTNDLHGSLFVQVVRPGLNAYQRWNGPGSVQSVDPVTGLKKTPAARNLLRDENRYNQPGGSIGGPIWRNKIFAFFNYESQSENIAATSSGWYATSQLAALAPSGSIAAKYLSFPKAGVLGTVNGSVTCSNAGLVENVNCKTIAGQGLNVGSPVTTGLGTQDLTYVSSSNPGIGGGLTTTPDVAEYTISDPTTSSFQQYNGRLDADATSRDHLSFAIYWQPATLTHYNGGYGYDLFHHSQTNDAFSVIWNHIFSPSFLNEARANAAGWRYNELTSNPQAPFGLPQDNVPQFASVALGSFGVSVPGVYDQWTYGYKDVATTVFRSQTIKFGFDLTRLYYLNYPIGAPNYTFYNLWDFMNDAPEAEGGPFQATTGIPGGFRNDNRENMYGIFVQDSWKAGPTLTVSAGLRYSYFGPLTDKANNQGVLTFGSASGYLTGITVRTGIGAWGAQKWNLGPELGFNWNPISRIVIRGGYGLNYNQEQIANANANDNNPPGTNYLSSSSKSPTQINPNILYAISSSPTSLFGYPANPAAITTFNAAGLPTAGGANLNALTNRLPTQYAHHYSLEVDYDFGHALVANLSYVGSTARHLMYNYDANGMGDIIGAALNPLVNSVNTFGNFGTSNNNMMLAGLKHQFSHNFSAEAQFTWAHSMDTDSGPYTRDPYLYNSAYSYGRSDFDINKMFKLFGVWQPVFFHGSHGWVEKIAGGWSLGGIMTLHSGYGWTPVYTEPHQIYCNLCNYGYQSLRPHYLGGAGNSTSNNAFKTGSNFPSPGTAVTGTPIAVSCQTQPISDYQFTNSYFAVPNYFNAITDCSGQSTTTFIPPPGIDRNSFPGPGYRDVDFNFAKAFGLPNSRVLGENAKLEIKADMFNAFNLLNINPSSLSTNIQNSNLGQAGSALGSRIVDFQARFSF